MTFNPMPKRGAIRSPELMKRYRELKCQACGIDDSTVCGAHSNWAAHGKGKARKADDNRCASMCYRCHTLLDQGKLTRQQCKDMWFRAHVRTVASLIDRGLWPADVPLPDLSEESRP